ncbi:hypothetical protein H6F67_27235 [Microcoleus sp. FACHB-1515]|uniref:hypothetical protein n=1 Tax=Cyanophyceae TaxID=3028117 RepID=UPI0016843810|nr:hypothetical protein [Microcoleus sp. FACHB-1515]MBD2093533.1 hypothetical protein [Microcoleus sp. FACHB-1515]
MLNRTREYVDDAPISRTSRPIGYYISTSAIDALAAEFGQYLEKISPEYKCQMGSALFDVLGGDTEDYSILDSLTLVDPDGLMPDALSNAITRIGEEDSNEAIVLLLSALAAYVADDIRNGQEG